MHRVEILAAHTQHWAHTLRIFTSVQSAEEYGHDLFRRWTAAVAWRVVPITHPKREKFKDEEPSPYQVHFI